MVNLMVAGCYHPIPYAGMNKPARKHLPAHMIGHAHHRHDGENNHQHADMNGDEKHQRRDNNRAGQRFDRVKAHRGPSRWRAAGMVDSMGQLKPARDMH